MITVAIVIMFAAAVLAPAVHRWLGEWTGRLLSLLPLGFGVWLLGQIGVVAESPMLSSSPAWLLSVDGLDARLTFYLDGLSLTFAILISFIGGFVLLYASRYMRGNDEGGRFFGYLTGFMVSMLGLVLADNLVMMFVFWELTSITSYLLIGFEHRREAARKAAWQALLTTGLGGLLMLGGVVLIGLEAGTFSLSEIASTPFTRETSEVWWLAFGLLLAGCFTKSAQFPFHYWLPNAMEGPSPVSALLHSSTMVKAGVFLLARLSPSMGGDPAWVITLALVGGFTMVFAAFMASRETYLKKVLAYSTVSSLGILVMLIGLSGVSGGGGHGVGASHAGGVADALGAAAVAGAPGGEGKDHAVAIAQYAASGMMTYLIAHALFKAALFLAAGAVTKVTGEKDTERLGGLFRAMPVTAVCMAVSAASMAGLPPLFGFVGKEAVLHGTVDPILAMAGGHGVSPHGWLGWLATGGVAVGALLTVYAAVQVGWRPFFVPSSLPEGETTKKAPHEPDWPLLAGVVVLTGLTVLTAWAPGLWARPLIAAGVESLTGVAASKAPAAAWFDGLLRFGPAVGIGLTISAAALAGGWLLHRRARASYVGLIAPTRRLDAYGPDRWYGWVFDGMNALAAWQTRLFQSGRLVWYVRVVMLTTLLLGGVSLLRAVSLPEMFSARMGVVPGIGDVLLEVLLAVVIVLTTVFITVGQRRLAAVAMLGVIGYAIAVLFVMYGAADVAMTQFAVETLTVVIFVLVLYHMPRFRVYSSRWVRAVDVACALAVGAMVTLFVLTATDADPLARISVFHAENSYAALTAERAGQGRNMVNVILVDFRALDTMGEILVLGIAAFGVLTLLRVRSGGARDLHGDPDDHGYLGAGDRAPASAGVPREASAEAGVEGAVR